MRSHTTCVVFRSIYMVEDLGASKDLGVPSDDKCPLEDKSPVGVPVPHGALTFDFSGLPALKMLRPGLSCSLNLFLFLQRE